jgi:hypothetical protein
MAKVQLAILGITFLFAVSLLFLKSQILLLLNLDQIDRTVVRPSQFVRAQEEMSCRGEDVVFTEKEKGQIGECMKESKIDNVFKIPMEKLPVRTLIPSLP